VGCNYISKTYAKKQFDYATIKHLTTCQYSNKIFYQYNHLYEKKSLPLYPFLFLTTILQAQSLKSPDEFLGYPLGSKYTPHYKIVNYFSYVATTLGSQMKLGTIWRNQ